MYILIRNILVLSLMVVITGGISSGTAFAANVVYVNNDANGLNDGSSWDDAYTALEVALDNAASPDDIWVAAGIYQSSDSVISFNLVDGVDVYGGFAGDEDPDDPNFDLDDRDFSANKTELSGIKLGDGDNVAVVYVDTLSTPPILDGFTITGGTNYGLYCISTDQTIRNCIIQNSGQFGLVCQASDAVIDNCTISDNAEDGIYGNVTSNIQVSNCSISGNGEYGLELSVASTVENSMIRHNTLGGLTAPGQGMVMINNLVYDNTGNGIRFISPDASDILRNNTIVYNSGVGIKNDKATGYSPDISNCIVWGNTVDQMQGKCSAIFSCIQGGSPGSGNIADDPSFVLSDANDFHLPSDSPCVDAGVSDPNTYEDGELDIDGEARVYNDRIDIGADEYHCSPVVPYVVGMTEPNAIAAINAVANISYGSSTTDYSDTVPAGYVISQSITGAAPCGTVVDLVVSLGQLYVPDKSTDINGDGIVNYGDFSLQAAAWQSTEDQPGWDPNSDINNDNVVDINDLQKVAFDWLHITGDLDDDGFINYVDFGIFSSGWNSQVGEPNYDPEYDFDRNGFINLDDLLVLVNRWL